MIEMNSKKSKKKSNFNWVSFPIPKKLNFKRNFLIVFILAIMTYFLTFSLPEIMRRTLAVFVLSAGFWVLEVFPLPITGLMIPVILTLLGVFSPENAFIPFAHPVVFLMIGGLVLGESIKKYDLDKWIAYNVLKYSKGKLDRLIFLMMLVSAFLSMWMSNTVGIAIILPIALSILSNLPKEYSNLRLKMLLGISISTSIGGMAMITGSTPAMIGAAILEETRTFGFLQWAYYGFPTAIMSLLATFFVLKKMFPCTKKKFNLEVLINEKNNIGSLSINQKKVLYIFLGTIILWFLGSQIEIGIGLPPSISSVAIVSILSVLVMFGFNLLNLKDLKSIQWEIMFIVGGGILLGNAMSVSGAASKIGTLFAGLQGFLPTILILFSFIIITIIFTNFISNSATAAMLIPIAVEISKLLNINPVIFVIGTALAATIAFITPVGAPSTAMVYSTGQIPKKELIKTGFFIGLIIVLIIIALVWLLPAI